MAHVSESFAGARFGRLLVERLHPVKSKHLRLADVLCECGTRKTIPVAQLGKSANSCGCLAKDLSGIHSLTHGLCNSREYEIWCGMVKRCTNMGSKSYANYGGRGISVSDSWRSFENFFNDMGESRGLLLERVDNSAGYSKDNCVWATRAVQARNKRNNVYVLLAEEKLVLKDASAIAGVKYKTVQIRLSRLGWPIHKALGPEFSWPKGVNPYE